MKELIIFSPGEADDLASWSNIPYFFCDSLKNSFHLDKVDISIKATFISKILWRFYLLRQKQVFKHYGKDTLYDFSRSGIFDYFTMNNIKKGNLIYNKADAQIIFDFSHVPSKSSIPTIMVCDWTIEYHILEHLKREPNDFEKKLILKQYEVMRKADAVISLFPMSHRQICEHMDNSFYLGHVINCLEEYRNNSPIQYLGNRILFVGKPKYKKGLLALVKAISRYNKENPQSSLKLDVIGMTQKI